MLQDIRYEKNGHVALLTLDRPDARNAYSEAMVKSIVAALDEADADDSIRCVVVTGAGKGFCAGGDLKRMQDRSGGMFAGAPERLRRNYIQGIHAIPRRLSVFDKPVVAAVNGAAMGAGLDLACMCDIRVCGRSAKFGSSFVKVGLMSGDGGAYFLTRVVGFPRALEMLLTGRVVESEEALGTGLVHEVVEDGALMDAARARADALAALSPAAVRLTKRAAYAGLHSDLDQALQLAASFQGIVQNSMDHAEALAALLEKRAPVFEDR